MSGARTAETDVEMVKALSYVLGHADGCRLACEYMTPAWEIAQLMEIAAGTYIACIEAGDSADKFDRITVTYRAEFQELIRRLEEQAFADSR